MLSAKDHPSISYAIERVHVPVNEWANRNDLSKAPLRTSDQTRLCPPYASGAAHRREESRIKTAEQRHDNSAVTKVRPEIVDRYFDVCVRQVEVDPSYQKDVDGHLLMAHPSHEHQHASRDSSSSDATAKRHDD